jgi:hypothetical protein
LNVDLVPYVWEWFVTHADPEKAKDLKRLPPILSGGQISSSTSDHIVDVKMEGSNEQKIDGT